MPNIFLRTYWKSILLCFIIFVLSSVTFKSIPEAARFQYSDKLIHALMYVALGVVAFFEYTKDTTFKVKYKHWIKFVFISLVLFGGVIEILQGTLLKPRTAELADWIADIIGLSAGLGAGRLLFGRKE